MNYDDLIRALGSEIRAEASAQRLSLPDLAKRAGVSKPSIYRYLDGERDMPLPAFLSICDALGVDPADVASRAQQRVRRNSKGVSDSD